MSFKGFVKVAIITGGLAPLMAMAASSTHTNQNINSAEELLRFQKSMAGKSEAKRAELIGRDVKLQALSEYARSLGIRAGITATLESINNEIQANSRQLDAIYNFQPLMMYNRVVPPVITEAHDLYNQTSSTQIRTSGAVYNINSQAYFSSTPPNWRNYLKFPVETSAYEKFSYAGGGIVPENGIERKIWESATKQGWEEGVRHAGIMLEQSFDKLNRDYVGMVRYHILGIEGKVTMPVVNNYKLYDSNSGTRMVLDENLLKIEVLPTFKNSPSPLHGKWGAVTDNLSTKNDIVQPTPIKDDVQQEDLRLNVLEHVQDIQNETVQKPVVPYFKITQDPLTSEPIVYEDNDSPHLKIRREVRVIGRAVPVRVDTKNSDVKLEDFTDISGTEPVSPPEPPLRRYEDYDVVQQAIESQGM